MIKKMLKLDPEMFAHHTHPDKSPFDNTVDLTKYDTEDMTKDMREIMFRPYKMRRLYERYWVLASELDRADAEN